MTTPIDTLLAEHTAALARREAARAAFAAADADAVGITHALRDQGSAGLPGSSLAYKTEWLRAAEKAAAAMFSGRVPEASVNQIEEARLRWKASLARLIESAA